MPGEKSAANVGYVRLLRQNTNFRNLWFGELISSAGDWFNTVALLGLVLQLTGSGFSAGLVLIASTLPIFLLTPLAGPVVDRFDRRKVMLISNFLGAAFALSFLLIHDSNSVWIAYVGTALLVGTASFFTPAAGALTPTIVRREELFSANALSSSTWGVMVMVGSGIGGLMSALLGRELVFVFNGLSFLLSNLLIWLVVSPPRPLQIQAIKPGKKISTWNDFVMALSFVRQNPPVISLLGIKAGWALAAGIISLFAVFAAQIFKAGDAGLGLLYAARGAGALLGPILLRPLIKDDVVRMRWSIGVSFMFSAIGYTIFGLSAELTIFIAVLGLLIAHLGGGVNWVISSILLQEVVPNRLLGRVLALDVGLTTFSTTISTLLFGLALQNNFSPIILAFIAAAIFAGYGLLWSGLAARTGLKINRQTIDEMKSQKEQVTIP